MRSDCPISFGLDFFGDKWSLLIIRDMIFDGKTFYKDFLQSKEGMATNILSERLKKLEQLGLIQWEVNPARKTMKKYHLTQKGIDLIPLLLEVITWSSKYQEGLAVPADFVLNMEKGREEIIRNLKKQIANR